MAPPSVNSNLEDNEIKLSELFAALWSNIIFITLFTGLSIFLAGYYAITTEKKFTAKSIFQIEQSDSSSGFNVSGEIGTLATLAGFADMQTNSSIDVLLERATGREFIIDMKEKFSIDQDPYFNKYNPDYKDPFWKATIKTIIDGKNKIRKNAIIENNVLKNYRQNVVFELTEGGAIGISVTHKDPEKASYYANGLMEEIRQLVEKSAASQALRQLSFRNSG